MKRQGQDSRKQRRSPSRLAAEAGKPSNATRLGKKKLGPRVARLLKHGARFRNAGGIEPDFDG